MRHVKKFILLLGVLLVTTAVQAQPQLNAKQGQLGVKISPSISFNRVYSTPNNIGAASRGPSLRLKPGVIYDYPFRDNYYISTGLLYSVQQSSIEIRALSSGIQETHTLDYLQLPSLLKLYTGELILDTRLYVELGIVFQLRVNEKNVEIKEGQQQPFLQSFRRWGLAGLFGIGMEYDISVPTSLFVGISYQPGLTNVIGKQDLNLCTPIVMCHSDLITLDLGIRF